MKRVKQLVRRVMEEGLYLSYRRFCRAKLMENHICASYGTKNVSDLKT